MHSCELPDGHDVFAIEEKLCNGVFVVDLASGAKKCICTAFFAGCGEISFGKVAKMHGVDRLGRSGFEHS